MYIYTALSANAYTISLSITTLCTYSLVQNHGGETIDGTIGSVKEILCAFFRSCAAPSISAVSMDTKT